MTEPIATDSPFSVAQLTILKTLAGLIIPASDDFDLPGADDDAIFADIARSARDSESGLRIAIEFAQDLRLEPGATLADATALLEGQTEMAAVVAVVAQCYYRDSRVMQSLGMEARAPFPKGFEVDQGDWSLLEPVQQRGKLWRDVVS